MTGRKDNTERIRILLADDHKEMRNRIVQQLKSEFEIVGAVADGNAVLEAVSRMKPDVCILDISMPILGGIETANQLRASGSRVKLVFLTIHEDPDFVEAALGTGALGYVVKSRMALDLATAIRTVQSGNLFISYGVSSPVTDT